MSLVLYYHNSVTSLSLLYEPMIYEQKLMWWKGENFWNFIKYLLINKVAQKQWWNKKI